MKRCLKTVSLLLVLCVCMSCMFLMSGCSSKSENYKTEIISAKLDGKGQNIEIKATLDSEFVSSHKRQKVYLLSLDSTYNGSLGGSTQSPVAQSTVKDKVSFKIPLYENGKSKLASAFVLALYTEATEYNPASYVPITDTVYIENPESLATNTSDAKYISSVKGIYDLDSNRSGQMGVSHMPYELRIDKVLLKSYKPGAFSREYNGLSYFFDGDEITKLDKKIKSATDYGIKVYLKFILGMPEPDKDGKYEYDAIDCLYCPDALLKKSGYMINMTDENAVGYIDALFNFISDRYTQKNGEYGFCADFIICDKANSYKEFNNAGSFDRELYEKTYSDLVRHAYNIVKSHCKNSRIYLSTDNNWRYDTETDGRIGAKTFLNRFLSGARTSINYDWSIAMSMDGLSDTVWNESEQAYSTLTPNSLGEMSDLLSNPDYLYGKSPRSFIIDSLSFSSTSSVQRMSSSYAFSYYKAKSNGYVSALIYSSSPAQGIFSEVFNICGSSNASSLTSLESLIGERFADIYTALYDEPSQILFEGGYVTSLERSKQRTEKTLYDFSSGSLYGFFPSGNMEYISLIKNKFTDGSSAGALYASPKNTTDSEAATLSCIIKNDVRGSEIKASGYLGITLMADESCKVTLTITDNDLRDGRCATFTGVAEVGRELETVYFDISRFVKEISSSDNLTVSLSVEKGESDSCGISIYKLSLYGSSKSGAGSAVTVIVVILIVAAVGAVLFYLTVQRKKSRTYDESNNYEED